MSIQAIIDRAQSIEIDRKRIASQSVSRSQRVKVAERASAQPWRLTVTAPAYLIYNEARGIIETIMYTDRVREFEINLAHNPGQSYITAYQGDLNNTQLSGLTITNFTTSTMTIGGLPPLGGSITSSTVVFRSGDFIQPVNSRYPYTAVNTVLRGADSTVDILTNRPCITSENTSTTGPVLIGNSVTFRMVVVSLPTHEITPYNLVQFKNPFQLIERII